MRAGRFPNMKRPRPQEDNFPALIQMYDNTRSIASQANSPERPYLVFIRFHYVDTMD